MRLFGVTFSAAAFNSSSTSSILQQKHTEACDADVSSYFWLKRSDLASLQLPEKFCGASCGSISLNGHAAAIAQINPTDGHDACSLCGCDLVYFGLGTPNAIAGAGLKIGDKVDVVYSKTPLPPGPAPPTPTPPTPTPPTPPPSAYNVSIFKNMSNIYGAAYPFKDTGVVRYLGNLSSAAACEAACVAYVPNGTAVRQLGEQCHSFTYNTRLPGPGPTYQGLCFGLVDHTWELRDGSCPGVKDSCLTSGKIEREAEPCGEGAPSGCKWLVDPVCLDKGAPHYNGILRIINTTTGEAATQCAGDSACVGFTYSNNVPGGSTSKDTYRMITFVNISTAEKGGGQGCWSHRKFYGENPTNPEKASTDDPFRTAFHFQPPYGWM